jgi:uncharacterized protein
MAATEAVVGTDVRVLRRKWPDRPHYGSSGIVLGADEYGTWVGARPGGVIELPDGTTRLAERTVVWCAPHDDWYLLHYFADHPELLLYIDICTPPTWTREEVRMIDLDLDVIVWTSAQGGHIELVDVDEFEAHRVELDYPADLVAGAERAARDVLARVQAGDGPFTVAYAETWLARLP